MLRRAQAAKLKLLTIVSLAQESKLISYRTLQVRAQPAAATTRTARYVAKAACPRTAKSVWRLLQAELEIAEVRELEDTVIECIYQGLMVGEFPASRSRC